MQTYEQQYRGGANRLGCIELYGHWFLSMIGLFESMIRTMLFAMTSFIFLISYYFALCLSCGQFGEVGLSRHVKEFGFHQFKMFSFYSRLTCALIGNICKYMLLYLLFKLTI